MDRLVDYRYSTVIEASRAMIPDPILSRIGWPHVLTGTDPLFAGLHGYILTDDGRHYSDTAHVAYPWNQLQLPAARRRTTVVLQKVPARATVIHELGHALHETLDFGWRAEAIEAYGRTNEYEAFAVAFYCWIVDRENVREPRISERDLAFLESLAA